MFSYFDDGEDTEISEISVSSTYRVNAVLVMVETLQLLALFLWRQRIVTFLNEDECRAVLLSYARGGERRRRRGRGLCGRRCARRWHGPRIAVNCAHVFSRDVRPCVLLLRCVQALREHHQDEAQQAEHQRRDTWCFTRIPLQPGPAVPV